MIPSWKHLPFMMFCIKSVARPSVTSSSPLNPLVLPTRISRGSGVADALGPGAGLTLGAGLGVGLGVGVGATLATGAGEGDGMIGFLGTDKVPTQPDKISRNGMNDFFIPLL